MKNVSIVIPVYNEENLIDELISRLQQTTAKLPYIFDFIIVDDGSQDNTIILLQEHQKRDKRIKILKLTRNWGHQNAFNAGIDYTKGDAVILMDGDLEDPPELIVQFIDKWREGYDVIYGVKKRGKSIL